MGADGRHPALDFVEQQAAKDYIVRMSDANLARQAGNAPGLFHRLVDWSIFPASVAAACTSGFGLIFGVFGSITGHRANPDFLEAGVAAASYLIAAFATALPKRDK